MAALDGDNAFEGLPEETGDRAAAAADFEDRLRAVVVEPLEQLRASTGEVVLAGPVLGPALQLDGFEAQIAARAQRLFEIALAEDPVGIVERTGVRPDPDHIRQTGFSELVSRAEQTRIELEQDVDCRRDDQQQRAALDIGSRVPEKKQNDRNTEVKPPPAGSSCRARSARR